MRKKLLIATTKGLSFRSNLSFEVCYSIYPFKVQRHGWSHAATVPSEAPDNQKGRKRVSRDERRAMVESFVNKYRAENAGKFPKISDATKQVGGSYYVVREIIKELEYKSTTNSSNSVNEIFVEKQFDESKHPTTESVSVSSGNVEIATYNPIQDGAQLVDLDDKETVNTGYEHREEKRKLQTSYGERRLFEEVEIMSTPNDHCIAPGSNLGEKCSKEPYLSTLHMPNDIKTEEAVPTYSDSVAHQKVEEKCIKKVDLGFKDHNTLLREMGHVRRETPHFEDLHRIIDRIQQRHQVQNDVKSSEAVSSSSDSVTQERHPLKEEIDQISAPFIEKSVSSKSEGQRHDSKFVDMENHSAFEKAEYDRAQGHKYQIRQIRQSLQVPNDVKSSEAVSSSSDSVTQERHPLKEEIDQISAPFIEISVSSKSEGQRHDSKFVDMENHSAFEKAEYDRAQGHKYHIRQIRQSLQVPNDVKSSEAVSSSSDSVTQERHPLKEEIDQISAPFIEKSVSSKSEGQRHDSKFVDMENHSAFEKAEFERKDKEAVDGSNHEIEESKRSLELDESKMDSPSRDKNVPIYSAKSTLWGNVKSFANGILNIWKNS